MRAEKGQLIVVFGNGDKAVYTDNIFNVLNMLKDDSIKDIINSRGYIKKDYKVLGA